MQSTKRAKGAKAGALGLAATLLVVATGDAQAQRAVPMANGIPVAPTGVADNPLP